MTCLALIVVLALPLQGALAGPVPAAAAEIGYLLDYVGRSGCEFYRNGTWHDPAAAQTHLRDKYEALAARGQVATADDFIEKVATKSMLSGKAYMVKCVSGRQMPTGEWLRRALAGYRARATQGGLHPDPWAGPTSRVPVRAAFQAEVEAPVLAQSTSLIGGSPAMCMIPSSMRTSLSLRTS